MQLVDKFNSFVETHTDDKTQANALKTAVVGTGILWLILVVLMSVCPGFRKPERYKTISIMLEPVSESISEKSEKLNPAAEKIENTNAKEAAAPANIEKAVEKQSEPAKPVQKPAEQIKKQETAKKADNPAAKTVEKPAKSAEPVKPAESKPENSKAAPAKTVEQPKAAPKVPETTTAHAPKKAKIKYVKRNEDLMEEQMGASAKQKAFDDSMFDDVVAETNTSSQSVSKNVNRMDSSSALSGSAAVAADSTSGSVSATADRAEKPSSASSATSAMLSKISAAQYSTTIGNGLSSKSDVKVAQSTDGKLAIELSDGSARVLLEPLKPVIIISEENGKRIDSSRQVVISFRILAAGNVPFSGITITPSSALPEEIQSEIKDQVSTWRFAPASSDGQAKFEYSIIKR
ncbi:MAG: hypothetical protein MR911_11365 [Spirochaetia bacterium]|nr:hypothetical protein [Spirochaetia bacterium]MCI6367073.1 hypothetical protein [Spirochaetia bacterium]